MAGKGSDETDSDASKALAVRIFDENKQLREQIDQLKASNAELAKKKARSERESARQAASRGSPVQIAEPEAPPAPVADKKEHVFAPWLRGCPNCGKHNDNFKDEVVCDPATGGCGAHVGAYGEAKSYKECPSCGKIEGEKGKPLFKFIGSDSTIIQEIDKIVNK